MHNFTFNWDKSLEIGIETIDNQHKELFRIGREIEQILLINFIGIDADQLLRIVYELRDYITYHFYFEEIFMLEINYPSFSSHKYSHDNFINTIEAIDCENLYDYIPTLKDLLVDWTFEHICKEDRAIKDFIDT